METWDAIRSRRNVRRFTPGPIPNEHLRQILEAGRRTPSSKNQQRWDFIVCLRRDQLIDLARVWRGAGHVADSQVTVALVAPTAGSRYESKSIQYDLGQATMSMMLAAADLGIGSGHSAVADQDLAASILGLPRGRSCEWLISFGYPADGPLKVIKRPSRRPLHDVVHGERW
jgi:nitroreductase